MILASLWLFSLTVLWQFRSVLLPFGLAILIAFIIEPFVQRISEVEIKSRPVPRIAAVLSIYAVVGVIVYLFGSLTLPQIGREVAKIGNEGTAIVANVQKRMVAVVDSVDAFAHKNGIPLERQEIDKFLKENVDALGATFRSGAGRALSVGRDIIATLVASVFGMFLVLMLTAFLSIDKERIESFAQTMVPPEYRGSYEYIVKGITTGLAGVVRGQVMICMTNGVLTFVGLWLLGVKFPILLATMAAVFSLIPIFGSIISTIPMVAVAITQSFTLAVLVLLWIIGIHLLEANVLNPKIMGDAAHIHPVIVVFVLIVGEQTSGLIGALFAVPIAAVVLTFFKFMHQRAIEDGPLTASGAMAPATGDLPTPPTEPTRDP